MGTDSIAMLIEMKKRGIRPDLIQWADTGSERLHTYRYVNHMVNWLKRNDFPPLLIVRKLCPQAGHKSLYDQLWNTEQLPSPIFHRNHSCSLKWKLEPQRDYHRFLPWIYALEARTAIGFSAEETGRRVHSVAEAVGFNHDEENRRSYQIQDSDGYMTYYPLQEWRIDRQECVNIIAKAGMPQPGKSACFMCPMSKLCEIKNLRDNEREASFALEKRAADGGKLKSKRGLRIGKNITWSEWLQEYKSLDVVNFVGLVSDVEMYEPQER